MLHESSRHHLITRAAERDLSTPESDVKETSAAAMRAAVMRVRREGRELPMLVVYDSPMDHPGEIVVRLWKNAKPTLDAWTFGSLDEARQAIPTNALTCIPRSQRDVRCIVETCVVAPPSGSYPIYNRRVPSGVS